jgi:succinoglycan exporter
VFAERLTNPYLELLAGGAVGAFLYGILFLLTERALLRKLWGMVRRRRGGSALEGSSA